MTDTTTKVREHYNAANLIERIKSALATIAPEEQTLTVAQLAPLDQFHTLGQHKKRRPTVKKNLLSLAMSLALLMSAATQAQTTHLTITVPFEFTAGNVQLPAGEYEVTAVGPRGGPTLSGPQREFERRDTRSFDFLPIVEARCRRQAGFPSLWQPVFPRRSVEPAQLSRQPDQDQLAANGVDKEPIEGRSRADRVGEIMMLAQFHFKPGGSP